MLSERDCLQSPYNDLIGCNYAYTLLIVILEAQNLNLKDGWNLVKANDTHYYIDF